MILLDTNVLIYAFEAGSAFQPWARHVIADAVANEGAIVNPIVLAEVCVGDSQPDRVGDRICAWGVEVTSLPAAAAPVCAAAFSRYRARRARHTGGTIAPMPLPDFFIGAHARIIEAKLATADTERYLTYFPEVTLISPEGQ